MANNLDEISLDENFKLADDFLRHINQIKEKYRPIALKPIVGSMPEEGHLIAGSPEGNLVSAISELSDPLQRYVNALNILITR